MRTSFLIGFILIFYSQCYAGEIIFNNQVGEKPIYIWDHLNFYLDSTGTSINEISNKNFNIGVRDSLLWNYHKGVYWINFSIHNANSATVLNLFLECNQIEYEKVTFYFPNDFSQYDSVQFGKKIPTAQWPIKNRNPLVLLSIPPGKKYSYYMKVESTSIDFPIFALLSSKNGFQKNLDSNFQFGINYGFFACCFVLNFILFIFIRQKLYFYYLLFIFFEFLCIFTGGHGFITFWGHSPFLNNYILIIARLGLIFSILAFSLRFFHAPRWLFKLSFILFTFRSLIFIFQILTFSIDKIFNSTNFSAIADLLLLLIPLMAISKDSGKNLNKIFFLASHIIFILGYMFFISYPFRQIIEPIYLFFTRPDNYLDISFFFSFCAGLQTLLLSIALVVNIRSLHFSNEKAQAKIIFELQEKEKLKDKLNSELEQKVNERTEEVQKQALAIEKMNALLKDHNISLEKNIKDLSIARVMQKEVSFEEFKEIYSNDEACYHYLERKKWGNNPYNCKKCCHLAFYKGKMPLSRKCSKCNFDESVTYGTIFYRLKFPLVKAFYLLFLFYSGKKYSFEEISQIIQLRKNTCILLKKKVDEAIVLKKSKKSKFNSWEDLIFSDLIKEKFNGN